MKIKSRFILRLLEMYYERQIGEGVSVKINNLEFYKAPKGQEQDYSLEVSFGKKDSE